jgi:hypothetical protein
MESGTEQEAPFKPPTRREALVPAMAVAAVAIIAVTAAVMVKRGDDTPLPVVAERAAAPVDNVDVVKAPPLERPATSTMGAAPVCKECGIVQMVVAVYDTGGKEPRAYQMHLRMDDGTVRTVVQRGALAAGSRVMVDGSVLKPVS